MTASANKELALISIITGALAVMKSRLPVQMDLGYVVLALGLVFLVQTLLRDLWLLYRLRKRDRSSMPAFRCVCLESGAGFIPLIIAAVLIPCGCMRDVALAPWFWPSAVFITLLAGMGLKDYVIDLRPFRMRRDPDHINYRFGGWR